MKRVMKSVRRNDSTIVVVAHVAGVKRNFPLYGAINTVGTYHVFTNL
jgi:hypothetical protein